MVQSDLDLLLSIPAGLGRRGGLQEALRLAIRSGGLSAGTRLPSTRVLAADLGMARGTVVDAYDQLVAEGWLSARRGSGTVVASVPPPKPAGPATATADSTPWRPHHDLYPGRPEQGSFPRAAWAAATRRALSQATDEVWVRECRTGRPELRRALAAYLGRARGVAADPEHIVVTAGFAGGLDLVTSLIPPATFAVEEVCLAPFRQIIERRGHRLVPIPVGDEGADADALERLSRPPAAALVTPAHQYPLGITMSPARRHALLAWASRHGSLIIEDDYDSEFRYDRQPVGALQPLDPHRVVYLGTVSKTLGPALRIGWAVLPASLAEGPLASLPATLTCPIPVTEQLVLAELIGSGGYDRHVRRMRQRYRRRRDRLAARLAEAAPQARWSGVAAGLHALVQLPESTTEAAVLEACRRRGVIVAGLRSDPSLWTGWPAPDRTPGIIVGYGTPPAHDFEAALEALVAALVDAGLGDQGVTSGN